MADFSQPRWVIKAQSTGFDGKYNGDLVMKKYQSQKKYVAKINWKSILMVFFVILLFLLTTQFLLLNKTGEAIKGSISTSIAALDLPFVVYGDTYIGPAYTVGLIQCLNQQCSSSNLVATDNGLYPSITVENGTPTILYEKRIPTTGGPLGFYLMRCTDATCATTQTRALVALSYPLPAGTNQYFQSITTSPDGYPFIIFNGSEDTLLHTMKCHDEWCNSFTELTPTASITGTSGMDVEINSDGLPIFAAVPVLQVHKCQNPECSSTVQSVLDSSNEEKSQIDLVIGSDGLPIISYMETGVNFNPKIRVIKCLSIDCSTVAGTVTLGIGIHPKIVIERD